MAYLRVQWKHIQKNAVKFLLYANGASLEVLLLQEYAWLIYSLPDHQHIKTGMERSP